jgi:hypothetical protein
MNKYTLSTHEVLGLLSDTLYPSPDGDAPRGFVWWRGRPFPWPGPAGRAFGIPTPQPAIDPYLGKALEVASAAALITRMFSKNGEATRLAVDLFDKYCGNVPLAVLLRHLLGGGPVPVPEPEPRPNWLGEVVSALELGAIAERIRPSATRDDLAYAAESQLKEGLEAMSKALR